MTNLAAIRREMGFSQKILAEMLGMTRSHLNMVEQEKRKLPIAAALILANLKKAQEEPSTIQPELAQKLTAFAEENTTAFTEQLHSAIKKYELQRARLIEKREKMAATHATAKLSAKMIADELRLFAGVTSYEVKLQNQLSEQEDKLKKTDPSLIAVLDWKISELTALISLAEEEINKWAVPTIPQKTK
jgi:transcriptional regulator with XRE-family HTH domain